jgi:lipoyl(octanoyl) transferase
LVGYPIINLRYYQQDLHWYLRQLETVIIKTVANYGLSAYRIPNFTGVWLEGKKIAAIGIKVRRWITMHGFAINVCPNMSGFKQIVPCGIADKSVGSLQEFVPEITVDRVRIDVAQAFASVFQVELVEQDALNQVK